MPKLFKKRLFNQRGITLIELIAVILIIGIIAAVGIPVVFNQIENAQEEADSANMAIVNDAVERYALVEGHYPAFTEGDDIHSLITELQLTTTKGGPYLSQGVEINFESTPTLIEDDGVITGIE